MLTLSLALVTRAFFMSPDVPSRNVYPQLFHTATPDLHMDRNGAVVKRSSICYTNNILILLYMYVYVHLNSDWIMYSHGGLFRLGYYILILSQVD